MARPVDDLDRNLLSRLPETLEPAFLDLARLVGVARNTAAARIAKLTEAGILAGYRPNLDLGRLGFVFGAFTQVSIQQGMRVAVVDGLKSIPEVIEAHITTGDADLICRIVATDHDHLRDVLEAVQVIEGVVRTHTTVVLSTEFEGRELNLIQGDPD